MVCASLSCSANLAYTKQLLHDARCPASRPTPEEVTTMSNFTTITAASGVAAAYAAVRPLRVWVNQAVPAHCSTMSVVGRTDVVFGKGHKPRGIPL
jgi:hypothetical protein